MKPLLWDRDPVGAPFICTFLQSRSFRIVVPKKVFCLAERLATQRVSNVQTSLVARVVLPEQNRLEIVVNRIECPLQPCPKISSLTDELLLPIELLHKPNDVVACSEEFISSTQKTILGILDHAPNIDLCTFFTFRTRYLLNTTSTQSLTTPLAQFCVDAFSIDCPMRFQRVQTLKLISSALARSLETNLLFPMASSYTRDFVDPSMELRFGYLSVTSSNEFSVHLDSDPSALSANLAGLWISGIPLVKDPRVWAACFRFLLSKQVKRRYINPSFPHFESDDALRVPNVSMLLLFYGATTGPPACYEVDWGYGSLQATPPYNATQLRSTSIPGEAIHFNLHRGMGSVHSFSSSSNTPEMYSFDLHLIPKDPLIEKIQSAVKPYLFPINTVPLELGVSSTCASMSETESSYVFSRNSIALSNPPAYEDPFSLPDTQFNVPDASLLFEEGVATSTSGLLQSSHSQNTLHSIVSQTSVEYSADAIPRQPPSSSLAQSSVEDISLLLVEKKSLSTICEDDGSTTYDPARYHTDKENETAKTVEVASTMMNKPPNCSSIREKKFKPNPSTPTALHSLLATLPPSQLKRLEQIICTLLDKSHEQKKEKVAISKTAAREQAAVVLLNDVQAVDVAVNTTQLYVDSMDSSTPHNPTIRSNTCTVSNPEGINKLFATDSRQLSSSKSTDGCQTVQMTCAAAGYHAQPAEIKASSRTVYGTSKRTLGDFASLLSLPQNATSQTAPPPECAKQSPEVSDRYSNLLASIQVVLDRQSKSRSKPAQCHSVTSAPSLPIRHKLKPQSVPNSGESICDYPLDTLNIRSQSSTPCVDMRHEPVNGQNEPPMTTASLSNDRVAHWLRTDTTESHVPSSADQGDDFRDTQLSDAVLNSQLITGRCVNDTAFSENHSKCTLTPSLISANLCNYSLVDDYDVTAAQLTTLSTEPHHCADSQLTTETDQSLYLAALVEKYLGLKIESSKETVSDEGRRRSNGDDSAESLAVTRYGGLNPTDMSLATQCYLERHGILDKGCESKKNNKAFCSSTPLTGSPLISPKPVVGRNTNRDDPHRYAPRKQTQEALYLPVNTIPNILDGLNLERSPLADTNAKCIPDTRLLPTLSETSHFSNETCVALGPITRTKLCTDQMPVGETDDGRILDIDRLRSLPKLL